MKGKRPRVPHFISGIGDGNADYRKPTKKINPAEEDDIVADARAASSMAGKYRLRRSSNYKMQYELNKELHQNDRDGNQQKRQQPNDRNDPLSARGNAAGAATDRDDLITGSYPQPEPRMQQQQPNERYPRFDDGQQLSVDHWKDIFTNEELGLPADHTTATDTSLYSAFLLVGMIVVLSALFLHTVFESNHGNDSNYTHSNTYYGYYNSGSNARGSRRRQQQRQRRMYKTRTKKKTDEWSDDEEEVQNGARLYTPNPNGVGGAGSVSAAGNKGMTTMPTDALMTPERSVFQLQYNHNNAIAASSNTNNHNHNNNIAGSNTSTYYHQAYAQNDASTHSCSNTRNQQLQQGGVGVGVGVNQFQLDRSQPPFPGHLQQHTDAATIKNAAAGQLSTTLPAASHFYHSPKHNMGESQTRYRNASSYKNSSDFTMTAVVSPHQQKQHMQQQLHQQQLHQQQQSQQQQNQQPQMQAGAIPEYKSSGYSSYYGNPTANLDSLDVGAGLTMPSFKTTAPQAQLRQVNANRSPAINKTITNRLNSGSAAILPSTTTFAAPKKTDDIAASDAHSGIAKGSNNSNDDGDNGLANVSLTTPESTASSASRARLVVGATPKISGSGAKHNNADAANDASRSLLRPGQDASLLTMPEEIAQTPTRHLHATPLETSSNFSSFTSSMHNGNDNTAPAPAHNVFGDDSSVDLENIVITTSTAADGMESQQQHNMSYSESNSSTLKNRRSSATSKVPSSLSAHMYSSFHASSARSNHHSLLLSPGHADETPRVGNVRKQYRFSSADGNNSNAAGGNACHHILSLHDGLKIPSIDVDDRVPQYGDSNYTGPSMFPRADDADIAAIAAAASGNDAADDVNHIPFLPNLQYMQKRTLKAPQFSEDEDDALLGEVVGRPQNMSPLPPPESLSMEELELVQMETGNSTHWDVRVQPDAQPAASKLDVTRPSSRLQHNPKQAGGRTDAILRNDDNSTASFASETSMASGDDITIPSGDPHKNIRHVRPDLTMSTDSKNSLKTKIRFEELKLQEVIGGGGFGQIWKATWRGTPVAVKILTGSAQGKRVAKSILQEFKAEINLLKGMRHPNICLFMGACFDPPNRAIITELAINGSVWDSLRLPLNAPYVPADGTAKGSWPMRLYVPNRHGTPPSTNNTANRLTAPIPPKGTWPWKLVKNVASGAAQGMAYLHSGDPPVLHRDLKSANLLLTESYTAKVCDFGLSRLKSQERSMTGNCGTVQWMAPEVLANMKYNEKADIYSFGIICWELLSRECPYDGMSAIQCALAVLNRDKRPDIPKWCPPPFQALIRSCIKKDPNERPTFEQIILALEAMP